MKLETSVNVLRVHKSYQRISTPARMFSAFTIDWEVEEARHLIHSAIDDSRASEMCRSTTMV
jgi:hypothetical protein